MRRILIPAALTVFAAAIVVVSLVPDGTERTHVTTGDLELGAPTMTDAEALLSAALLANGTVSFEGTLTVVGVEGPNVFQIEVEAEADGTRMVNSGSWLFGRGGGERWASSDSGESMEAANADAIPDMDIDALLDKYRLHVAGVRELPTGPAHVVVVTDRESGVEREWLSVDDTTGMLVRRETFDDEGAALRLVAFETLRTSGVVGQALPELQFPIDLPDTLNGIEISELPGHFRLQGVASHDEAEIPTTGLRFSDGLYRLSIYSQEGGLDGSSLRGAVREHWGDMDLYRWPGAEPQRLVWSGDGHTYTAITNAPMDAVLPALSQFPSDPVGGLLERMRRGASRVANTIWPFD